MDPHITDDNRGARLRFRRLERERAAAITQIRDLMLKYEISIDDIQPPADCGAIPPADD